jgi:hypothetical protein
MRTSYAKMNAPTAPLMNYSFSQVALMMKPGVISSRLQSRTHDSSSRMNDARKTFAAIRALTPHMQQLRFTA